MIASQSQSGGWSLQGCDEIDLLHSEGPSVYNGAIRQVKMEIPGNMHCHSVLIEESTHAHFTALACSAWHIPFVMLVMDLASGSRSAPGPRRSGPAPGGGSVRIER